MGKAVQGRLAAFLRGAAALLLVTGCASCLGNGSLPLCLLLLLVARQGALSDGGCNE